MFLAIVPFLTSLTALAILLLPRIWKTPQDKEDARKEKVKEMWDKFYESMQKLRKWR